MEVTTRRGRGASHSKVVCRRPQIILKEESRVTPKLDDARLRLDKSKKVGREPAPPKPLCKEISHIPGNGLANNAFHSMDVEKVVKGCFKTKTVPRRLDARNITQTQASRRVKRGLTSRETINFLRGTSDMDRAKDHGALWQGSVSRLHFLT
jgi:hypothetical protein